MPVLFKLRLQNTLYTLCFCLLLTQAQAQEPAWVRDSMDAVIRNAMTIEQIPGLAVAVIKDGKVVVQRTYGLRNLNPQEPVDAETMFMIGSNTKAFTATALTQLESQNRLSLEDKVLQWRPDFKLYDSCNTAQVTLRDLLCHRLGTRTFQGDFSLWGSKLSRNEVIGKMSLLKPLYDFRTRFGYCNAAFVAAGEVAAYATGGQTWEEYMRFRFFNPLKMNRSVALSSEIALMQNAARPYSHYDNRTIPIEYPEIDNLAPAGAISASISDMTHWIQMQLDTGKFEGKEIFPKQVILKTWDVNTVVDPRGGYFYGLGWFVSWAQGAKMIEHTGGVDGFLSSTAFFPAEKLGIIVLTNSDNNALFTSLRDQLLATYLGKKDQSIIPAATAAWQKAEKEEFRRIDELRSLVKNAEYRPGHLFDKYAGKYTNPVYGAIEIRVIRNTMYMSFENHPTLSARLEYMRPHKFVCTFSLPVFGLQPMEFKTDGTKTVGLILKVNDFVEYGVYEFSKVQE